MSMQKDANNRRLVRISDDLHRHLGESDGVNHQWRVYYFQSHDNEAQSWLFRWSAPFAITAFWLLACFGIFYTLDHYVSTALSAALLLLLALFLAVSLRVYFHHRRARKRLQKTHLPKDERERLEEFVSHMPVGSSRSLWIGMFFSFTAVGTQALLLIWRAEETGMENAGFLQWMKLDGALLANGLTLGLSGIVEALDPASYLRAESITDRVLFKVLEVFITLGFVAYIIHFLKTSKHGYETVDAKLDEFADYLLYAHHAHRDNVWVEYIGPLPDQHRHAGERVGGEALIQMARASGYKSVWTTRKTDHHFTVVRAGELTHGDGTLTGLDWQVNGEVPEAGSVEVRLPTRERPIKGRLRHCEDGMGALGFSESWADEFVERFRLDSNDPVIVRWYIDRRVWIWPAMYGRFISAEEALRG